MVDSLEDTLEEIIQSKAEHSVIIMKGISIVELGRKVRIT